MADDELSTSAAPASAMVVSSQRPLTRTIAQLDDDEILRLMKVWRQTRFRGGLIMGAAFALSSFVTLGMRKVLGLTGMWVFWLPGVSTMLAWMLGDLIGKRRLKSKARELGLSDSSIAEFGIRMQNVLLRGRDNDVDHVRSYDDHLR